jgi:hypothetical protein
MVLMAPRASVILPKTRERGRKEGALPDSTPGGRWQAEDGGKLSNVSALGIVSACLSNNRHAD